MRKIVTLVLLALVIFPSVSPAKSKSYLFRSRANWVKLTKLSKKQIGDVELQQPATDITAAEMEAMLLSLAMNKASAFKNEVKTNEIFSIEEARKYAPYIVQALKIAEPNQVVNLSIVHERPYFVVQRDYLSMINIYKDEEGVHFNFSKLFAKLGSDYEQASKLDRAIANAKSLRVSLEAKAGQKLAYTSSQEIILDPTFDFIGNIERKVPVEQTYRVGAASQPEPTKSTTATTSSSGSTTERLKELEDLKNQKLITNAEYQKKRKEILGEL